MPNTTTTDNPDVSAAYPENVSMKRDTADAGESEKPSKFEVAFNGVKDRVWKEIGWSRGEIARFVWMEALAFLHTHYSQIDADNSRLRSENEQLVKERDEWKEAAETNKYCLDYYESESKKVEATLAELQAQLTAAKERIDVLQTQLKIEAEELGNTHAQLTAAREMLGRAKRIEFDDFYISDRGTGAKGSWYVGRKMKPDLVYHEYIGNEGKWCSAAKVHKTVIEALETAGKGEKDGE